MYNKLKQFKDNQELVSIFSDYRDTDCFSVGYVLSIDETFYIIEHISPMGRLDGYSFRLVDDIFKFESNNTYMNDISMLFKYFNQKRVNDINRGLSPTEGILEFAKSHNKICTIELCNSDRDDVVGFIEEYSETTITIKSIKKDGIYDGEAIINVEQIIDLSYGREEHQKIEILYNLKNKKFMD